MNQFNAVFCPDTSKTCPCSVNPRAATLFQRVDRWHHLAAWRPGLQGGHAARSCLTKAPAWGRGCGGTTAISRSNYLAVGELGHPDWVQARVPTSAWPGELTLRSPQGTANGWQRPSVSPRGRRSRTEPGAPGWMEVWLPYQDVARADGWGPSGGPAVRPPRAVGDAPCVLSGVKRPAI